MSCPSIRCRNTGSGYVKQNTTVSSDINKQLAARLMEREAQDRSLKFQTSHYSTSSVQNLAHPTTHSSDVPYAKHAYTSSITRISQ